VKAEKASLLGHKLTTRRQNQKCFIAMWSVLLSMLSRNEGVKGINVEKLYSQGSRNEENTLGAVDLGKAIDAHSHLLLTMAWSFNNNDPQHRGSG
jgi:hypothetical protein